MTAPDAADRPILDAWWQHVLATGELPPALAPVQGRLVRAVGRGALPSGEVFVKVMTFPRPKDRLRYLLRALPAARESARLRAVAAAGIRCPDVLDVRTARRRLLPHRSLLVLLALPAAGADATPPRELLREQAALAKRLLDAGWFHPDLNPDNFVRLRDGGLAVLDLQSLRRAALRVRAGRSMAARLLLEAALVPVADAVAVLVRAGLVAPGDGALVPLAARECVRFLRTRVRRCLQTSTEFVRTARAGSIEHRQRAALPPGRWVAGGAELRQVWLGQRLLAVFERRHPVLAGYRHGSWWLPGRHSVYVPAAISETSLVSELRVLSEGHARYRWLLQDGQAEELDALRRVRHRYLEE